ncbi:DUF3159 domain-containing protein [Streptomyces sp. A5-4]|uniref:DUF3159 domain-containing protein n=1 Tax=Streptomyces sp. A5-4 TaxID=3384771 RepID=UPI003DA9A70D
MNNSSGRRGPLGPREPRARRELSFLEQAGGLTGLVQSSLPSTVFVLVNSLFGLTVAIFGAGGTVLAFTIWRWRHDQPLKPALAGSIGVVISSFLAHRSGSARDFFLLDIWYSLAVAGVLVVSILVRRPLVGVIWSRINRRPQEWRNRRRARFGYDVATATVAAVFAARFVVQHWLYEQNSVGPLAFAKIAMNYPLWGLALVVVVWAVRRADRERAKAEEHRAEPRRRPGGSCWSIAMGR